MKEFIAGTLVATISTFLLTSDESVESTRPQPLLQSETSEQLIKKTDLYRRVDSLEHQLDRYEKDTIRPFN